ncbi:LL-diaminopimelate aminotransferase [Bacillus sp. ISL-47]|uniref:LL-diaminopimelate aminotransferase n=1 Tax=Bacillus sp. ISL-47 TaxID=2819130 RepID=UPI001BE886A6|nr:LL-diaminopimelate aminotransferase [Bacillus sp. ISL-47]MBT2690282.1 LL-diaminopimelate aminotransferase [Bacillus sp. ISL-47]MBT2708954.1 LL-diaminopimelate aminotransferase [Pseudomonas sp. ISL-84]
MNFPISKRMASFQESVFAELAQIKNSKLSDGIPMIDLSIGSPDLPPPSFITDELAKSSLNPDLYGYSLTGTNEFHSAVCDYYKSNFGLSLDPDSEVLLLMGSQDGLVHLPMVLCDPDDYILVPDPGYTAYAAGAGMAGAQMYSMPLKKENRFLPDLGELPEEILIKTKLMILNFPGNPVPAMATEEFYLEAICLAKKYNFVIVHDFAYSELYYERKPLSFLSVEGAMEVGLEMNSLSKSFNMAGCRVAYAAGNNQLITMLANFKSNLDYGVFLPVQAAASKALRDQSGFLNSLRDIYRTRRDVLTEGLKEIGWNVSKPEGSMFLWAEVPEPYNSKEFAIELINRANVVVTPGNAFGKWGEGYVRIALVQPEEVLKQAAANIGKSGILKEVLA